MRTEIRSRFRYWTVWRVVVGLVMYSLSPHVVSVAAAAPTIDVSPATTAPGSTLTVTIASGPGNAKDWVGLYQAGAPDTAMIDWKYLNGQRTAPTTGTTGATVTFAAPSSPGTYNIRFYSNDTYTVLATSAPITVQSSPTPASLTVTPL